MITLRQLTIALCAVALACSSRDFSEDHSDTATIKGADGPRRKLEGFPPAIVARLTAQDSVLLEPAGQAQPQQRDRVRGVIRLSKRWRPGDVITVAFDGGTKEVRDSIAQAALTWTQFANVTLNFWTDAQRTQYREWSPTDRRYTSHVRIAFDPDGYWSYIGRESVDRKYAPHNSASLNLEQFDLGLPSYWRQVVLHEFGHVLAIEHEHQNPFSTCEQEFRWEDEAGYVPTRSAEGVFIADAQGRQPGIYRTLGGPPNNWDRATTDFNLRQFAFDLDIGATAFDPMSIMKYYFDETMFRSGRRSSCFAEDAQALSAGDQATATEHYPRLIAGAPPREREVRDAIVAANLPVADRAEVLRRIDAMMRQQTTSSASIPSTPR